MKGEEEALYTSESRSNNRSSTKRGYNGDKRRSHQGTAQVKVGAIIGRLPNVDTMVTKEEATKELHNLRELKRTTTRVSKERDLEVFAIIGEKWPHVYRLLVHEKVC